MIIKPRVLIAGLLTVIAAVAIPQSSARAQALNAAETATLGVIGKLTVGDVLDKINQLVANCASIANNSVNLDYGNAFISLQAGLQGVTNTLDDEKKSIVNSVDDQRKAALLDVYNLATDMAKDQIPLTQAKLKVDTLTILNHVAILGKKTPFMISLIDPTVIADKPTGDYQITVVGIGIGNQEGTEIPTTVTISPPGTPQDIKPDNANDGITFVIPRSTVEPLFSDTTFTYLPVKIESTIKQPCGPLHIRTCNKSFSFSWRMTLFPRQAVNATVEQIEALPALDPSSRKPIYTQADTPNGDGNNGHGIMHSWSTPVVVPDTGYQITSIDFSSCENGWVKPGNPCAFYNYTDGWNIPKNGGASALISGQNWSWPLILHFTVWEEKKITVSQNLPSYSVSFAAGESLKIIVAQDAASATITAVTATGKQVIIPLVPPGGEVTDPVVCGNAANIGSNQTQFICTAKGIDYY